MELSWLEDFLALAEQRNFSRAAAARNVTQPAFSRRIRALEEWVGTPLAARSPQGAALNAAGEHLAEHAAALLRDLHQARRGALRAAGREAASLSIAATHALSFTFLPGWIRAVSPPEELGPLNVMSDTMAACERVLMAGDADFLLCHARGDVASRLVPPDAFAGLVVGHDLLVPVSAPDGSGRPRWSLPGTAAAPVRLLRYSDASGLGRILDATARSRGEAPCCDTVFTSPLAAALHGMARQGQGLAWLPRTMAAEDLAAGHLLDAGDGRWSVAVEIRLFRARRRQSRIAEAFWRAVAGRTAP